MSTRIATGYAAEAFATFAASPAAHDVPPATLAALGTLAEYRGAEINPLDAAAIAALPQRTGLVVWIVTADSMEAGAGDLDNHHDVIGVYANLEVATAEIYRLIVISGSSGARGVFYPIFTQHVVSVGADPEN